LELGELPEAMPVDMFFAERQRREHSPLIVNPLQHPKLHYYVDENVESRRNPPSNSTSCSKEERKEVR
jgi:hypothetical protein